MTNPRRSQIPSHSHQAPIPTVCSSHIKETGKSALTNPVKASKRYRARDGHLAARTARQIDTSVDLLGVAEPLPSILGPYSLPCRDTVLSSGLDVSLSLDIPTDGFEVAQCGQGFPSLSLIEASGRASTTFSVDPREPSQSDVNQTIAIVQQRDKTLRQLEDPPYPEGVLSSSAFGQQIDLSRQNLISGGTGPNKGNQQFTDSGYGTRDSQPDVLSMDITPPRPSGGILDRNFPQPDAASSYEDEASISESMRPTRNNQTTRSRDAGRRRRISLPPNTFQPCRCPWCHEEINTHSQMRKHEARHRGIWTCQVPGCPRSNPGNGFGTVNDRDRHQSGKHKELFRAPKYYRCFASDCSKSTKDWDRFDNFKTHIEKVHAGIKRKEDRTPERLEMVHRLIEASNQWWSDQQQEHRQQQSHQQQRQQELQMPPAPPPQRPSQRPQPQRPSSVAGMSLFPSDDSINLSEGQSATSQSAPTSAQRGINPATSSVRRFAASLYETDANWSIPGTTAHRTRLAERDTMDEIRRLGYLPDLTNRRLSEDTQPLNTTSSVRGQTGHAYSEHIQPQQQFDPASLNPQTLFLRDVQFGHAPLLGAAWAAALGSKARTAPNPNVGKVQDLDSAMPSAFTPGDFATEADLAHVGSGQHLDDVINLKHHPPHLQRPGPIDPFMSQMDPAEEGLDVFIESLPAFLASFESMAHNPQITVISEAIKCRLRSLHAAGKHASHSKQKQIPLQPIIVRDKHGKDQQKCPYCNKTKNPADFKKHMRRHTRPYACTYVLTCQSSFGSKNDMKRHEHSRHAQPECWRCGLPDPHTIIPCNEIFLKRDLFQAHLRDTHGCSNAEVRDLARECRISRKNQPRYWCGFCQDILVMKAKGVDGDNERFSHICRHYLDEGKKIDEWLPPQGHKTTRELREEGGLGTGEQKAAAEQSSSSDSDEEPDPNQDGDQENPSTEPTDRTDHRLSPPRQLPNSYALSTTLLKASDRPQKQPWQHSDPPRSSRVYKKRNRSTIRGLSDDHLGQESRRPRKRRPAQVAHYAICCQCRQEDMMLTKSHLLAISKVCVDCNHKFCKECQYEIGNRNAE